jgi:uncharacterized membrane protein
MLIAAALVALAACTSQPDAALPGNGEDDQPFSAIGEEETIRIIGTEPFWGGEIAGDKLTWTTPENIDGEEITVTRFAGRGGLSFSGELADATLDIAITPNPCSDGMSDRTYPYTATVQLGEQQLNGCAWSEVQSYSGGE